MHLDRRIDHSPRYLVDLHPHTLCAVCDYEFTTEGTENTEVITEVNQYSGPIPQDTEHRGRPVFCAPPVSSASSVGMKLDGVEIKERSQRLEAGFASRSAGFQEGRQEELFAQRLKRSVRGETGASAGDVASGDSRAE